MHRARFLVSGGDVGENWTLLAEISDAASLAVVSDLLHDAIFREEDAAYDEGTGTFRVLLWRERTELSETRRVLPLVTREVAPMVRAELQIRRVREARIRVTDRVGLNEYLLTEIRYDESRNTISLQVMGPLEIVLAVDALDGELRDIGEPTWDRPSVPTYRLGWGRGVGVQIRRTGR